jgi:hypothetical protein
VRALCTLGLTATLSLASPFARADGPRASRSAAAFVWGASSFLAGFIVGGTLLGTSASGGSQENAGWLAIEAGFTIAPIASHAVAGEGWRGLVFAAPPAIATGGTAALFASNPSTIERGSIEQQRLIWGLFVGGLIASVAGVIDGVLTADPSPNVAVAPTFGRDHVGLTVGARL